MDFVSYVTGVRVPYILCGMWYDRSNEKNIMLAAMPGNLAISEERLSKVFHLYRKYFSARSKSSTSNAIGGALASLPSKGIPSCVVCSSFCLKSSLWLCSSMRPLVALSPLCAKKDGYALL